MDFTSLVPRPLPTRREGPGDEATPLLNIMAEELKITCAVCLEPLKDPKILSCCHSFCKCCLKGIIDKSSQKKKLACPQCRALHSVSSP